jgi:hypothetical protein
MTSDIDTFMDELSENGCIYGCDKDSNNPKKVLHIIKVMNQDEVDAFEMIANDLTKYCEFENDVCSKDEEFINSVCKIVEF